MDTEQSLAGVEARSREIDNIEEGSLALLAEGALQLNVLGSEFGAWGLPMVPKGLSWA